jgi:hypothetical protein
VGPSFPCLLSCHQPGAILGFALRVSACRQPRSVRRERGRSQLAKEARRLAAGRRASFVSKRRGPIPTSPQVHAFPTARRGATRPPSFQETGGRTIPGGRTTRPPRSGRPSADAARPARTNPVWKQPALAAFTPFATTSCGSEPPLRHFETYRRSLVPRSRTTRVFVAVSRIRLLSVHVHMAN